VPFTQILRTRTATVGCWRQSRFFVDSEFLYKIATVLIFSYIWQVAAPFSPSLILLVLLMMMLMILLVYFSYDDFYDQQSTVMNGYPDAVQTEVKAYAKSITSYFCVKRSTNQNVSDYFAVLPIGRLLEKRLKLCSALHGNPSQSCCCATIPTHNMCTALAAANLPYLEG